MAQKKFIIDGGFQTNADSVIAGNLGMTGHIIPSVDSDGTTGYDLGSPTAKWRDLYLSQGSLYIDGQKVLESNAGTIVVQADVDQSLLTKTTGAGVLTLQSPNPISISGTLQMGTGKRITSADAVAVVFGDKIDMDNNQIINVAAPTATGHVATKGYVDTVVSDVLNGAPAALDTLNELANALGDDANFASTVTTALATKATITYVDAEIASLRTTTNAAIAANTGNIDAALVTAAADATIKANAALADANDYTDNRETAITSSYQSYADQAEADAIFAAAQDATTKAGLAVTEAKDYTDTREGAITTAYQAYADQAEANAKDAAATDATFKADAAEAAANAYTDGRETAITTAYQSYTDTAKAAAISTAATDATTKADQALVDAKAYTDAEVSALEATVNNIISNTDGAALDSLTEIVSAFQSADSTLNGAITTLASDATSARAALETSLQAYADQAEADAISTAAADATTKANAAESAANTYTDGREAAIITAYTTAISASKAASDTYADAAEADAITSANAYTDGRETAITTAYQAYADQAEADAISTAAADATAKADAAESAANAYTDGRETAITTAYTTAIATAKTEAIDHTDARETAITTAYTTAIATAKSEANSYTDAAISDLVDGAPAALDTLNELAAALGDDANFATTVTTSLATKAATTYVDSTVATAKSQAIATAAADATTKADAAEAAANTYTSGRETAITTAYQAADATLQSAINTKLAASSYTAADVLAKIKTVDGAGSGLDADLLDGQSSSYYATAASVTAEAVARDTAITNAMASLVNFHSATQTVTSTQSATNVSATVNFTFADLATAKHYNVYLNRQLLRPGEYSVSGSTVTFAVGVLASDDELEVSGLKTV